jgi:hypothetical protein
MWTTGKGRQLPTYPQPLRRRRGQPRTGRRQSRAALKANERNGRPVTFSFAGTIARPVTLSFDLTRKHVHEERYSDEDFQRLKFYEHSAKTDEPSLAPLYSLALQEYRKNG